MKSVDLYSSPVVLQVTGPFQINLLLLDSLYLLQFDLANSVQSSISLTLFLSHCSVDTNLFD